MINTTNMEGLLTPFRGQSAVLRPQTTDDVPEDDKVCREERGGGYNCTTYPVNRR